MRASTAFDGFVARAGVVHGESDDVVEMQLVLYHRPTRDAPVRRHREEVEVVVKVVLLPAHLPHRVRVFTCETTQLMTSQLASERIWYLIVAVLN